jgi:hypothetical protein
MTVHVNGFYWVRLGDVVADDIWQPAWYCNGQWLLCGCAEPLPQDARIEVGARLERAPGAMEVQA